MIEVAGMEFIDNINVKQAEVNKEKEIQLLCNIMIVYLQCFRINHRDIYQELRSLVIFQILSSDSEERIIGTRRAVMIEVAGMEFIDNINVKQAEVNNSLAAMVDMEAMVKPGEGDPTVKDSSE